MSAEKVAMRPEPVSQPESDRYWAGAREGELWLQRDRSSGGYQFYPRAISLANPGGEMEWVKASGRAILYTFGIVHVPPHPGFVSEAPYVAAIVELEEGPRMAANIVGVEPDPKKLKIGMPLQVVFTKISETCTLPNFMPA